MKKTLNTSILLGLVWLPHITLAQPFDITTFDPTSTGPWSAVGRTTLMVPKVPNGSITLDGAASGQEYGGFQGVTVNPGTPEGTADNAWILDFPGDRIWGGSDDSSFTYWLAHDDDNFYIGVQAKDDVVTSDDPNRDFWKDDAIEIVIDALSDRLDNNTDSSNDAVGGHSYVNYQGRFSAWDETTNAKGSQTWASGVDWKYGQTQDVFGVGKEVPGGWQMEVRFKKRMFEDATAGNKLRNGYRMGFNIGLDDDDKTGIGPSGDMSRSQDLEIQYFWANRQRRMGYTAEYLATLTPEQKAAKVWLLDPGVDPSGLPLGVDSNGRLSHAGSGEIFFGYDDNAKASGKILFVTSADPPINADPSLIAWLRAKGYTVTTLVPPPTADEFRAAIADQNLVILSETIGSTSVLDPVGDATGVFALKDSDIPIISFEAYMYDNADWVQRTEGGANDFTIWGNTSRSEVAEEILDARDSLYIRNAASPIAGGLTGKVQVYNPPYSLNYGIPSADADVVASVQEDGSYPTIFVYEKGDKLVDGSVAPNKRIGFFLGQVATPNANWPPDYADLTEAGKTLMLNTIAFALGSGTQPSVPTLAVAREGSDLVLTYAGGTLQSADAVTGPWKDETGASPLKVPTGGSGKFYRVKG